MRKREDEGGRGIGRDQWLASGDSRGTGRPPNKHARQAHVCQRWANTERRLFSDGGYSSTQIPTGGQLKYIA